VSSWKVIAYFSYPDCEEDILRVADCVCEKKKIQEFMKKSAGEKDMEKGKQKRGRGRPCLVNSPDAKRKRTESCPSSSYNCPEPVAVRRPCQEEVQEEEVQEEEVKEEEVKEEEVPMLAVFTTSPSTSFLLPSTCSSHNLASTTTSATTSSFSFEQREGKMEEDQYKVPQFLRTESFLPTDDVSDLCPLCPNTPFFDKNLQDPFYLLEDMTDLNNDYQFSTNFGTEYVSLWDYKP